MDHSRIIKLGSYPEDRAIRAGGFSLLPQNPNPPLVISQPSENFLQYSWINSYTSGSPNYESKSIANNSISILQGTSFSLGCKVVDPSNLGNINDTSLISYRWKKDDGYLYEINTSNYGAGTDKFFITSSTLESSGEYVCEVINPYGSTDTEPLQINVIDPNNHPKLYKNLILNGDGNGGLDGWEGDEIQVLPFVNNLTTQNFGSFKLGGFAVLDENYGDYDFFFSISDHSNLFANFFYEAWRTDPDFRDINKKKKSSAITGSAEIISVKYRSQIIPNEDYKKSRFAGFFPGPLYMDKVNSNGAVVGLANELQNSTPAYFTRNKIKFEKFGGKQRASMTQTIDLTDAADLIDGMVYGIKKITSQFFAYVGAGITNYKIRVQTQEGEREFNYLIGDSEDVYYRTIGGAVRPSLYTQFSAETLMKLVILPNTDIEIIPVLNDITTIGIDFIDEFGEIIQTDLIKGPDETDVWAIKEKVYFPLTLWSVFEFLTPDTSTTYNNNITVFNQKYSSVKALYPFFVYSGVNIPGILGKGVTSPISDSIQDINAKFLLRKFPFNEYGAAAPPLLYKTIESYKGKTDSKALDDYGAAAMFGVGKNMVIPPKTRSVKITVEFNHTSEILKDENPQLKGWTSQEIYSDEYGQSTGLSKRHKEYGNPRCGITLMKFVLFPDDNLSTNKHATYQLPPPEKTTLGAVKQLYGVKNAFDNTLKADFYYSIYGVDEMLDLSQAYHNTTQNSISGITALGMTIPIQAATGSLSGSSSI